MPSISIVTFLVLLSLSNRLFAAGEVEFSKLKNIKPLLPRPSIVPPARLDKRIGFTEIEAGYFKTHVSSSEYGDLETTSQQFWTSPLLSAMAAAAERESTNDIDPDDEWFSRYYDNQPPIFFGEAEKTQYLPVPLVFLSAAGFSRIEASEELSPSSGRDLIAGIPAADFCESHPGVEVPYDFSVRFSPWDFGSNLVSTSRLDSSLLDLVQHPDAFNFQEIDLDEKEGDADNSSQSQFEQGDGDGWDGALARFDPRIKTGSLKISDVVAQTRKDLSIDQSVRRLLLAVAVSAQSLKKTCEKEGGLWTDLKWSDDEWLEFFACRNKNSNQISTVFRVQDGDFADGESEFSMTSGKVRFEASVRRDDAGLRVRYVREGSTVGSEYWFATTGKVRAVQNSLSTAGLKVLFGPNGQVEWINELKSVNIYCDISWYPDGTVRSFQINDHSGNGLAVGGFHANGAPKYWLPIHDGKKDGVMLWWHPSGVLAGELEFVSNKRFGRGTAYYENGAEGFRVTYSDDAPHGRMNWRDPSNKILFSLGFTGGRPHGNLEIKHGDRVIAEAKFDGGTVYGSVILKNQKGAVVAEIPYKNSLLDGVVILRDSTGAIRVRSQWFDGQLNGVTETTYVSGTQASSCNFKNGQLLDWSSYRPDGGARYEGQVTSFKDGRSIINYFGGTEKPILKCSTSEWIISDCDALGGGSSKPAPALKDLLAKVVDGGKLKLRPEKCGGAIRSFDVSPLGDLPRGKVDLSYRVKELCPADTFATGLQCDLEVGAGKWTISSCVYSDDDLVEED